MSTLAEIESAVESLPARQQELLLRHLEMKLHGRSTAVASLVLEEGRPVLVAPPRCPGDDARGGQGGAGGFPVSALLDVNVLLACDWQTHAGHVQVLS